MFTYKSLNSVYIYYRKFSLHDLQKFTLSLRRLNLLENARNNFFFILVVLGYNQCFFGL